jgi:hypothetical protein
VIGVFSHKLDPQRSVEVLANGHSRRWRKRVEISLWISHLQIMETVMKSRPQADKHDMVRRSR